MSGVLELLLHAEIPQPQQKRVKLKRLSRLCGEEVVFTLQELGFSRVAEIRKCSEGEEMELHILLTGVKEPNLKDTNLMQKYSAVTPLELLKKLLLPGEITDLSRAVEKLSGYRVSTIEELDELKKK